MMTFMNPAASKTKRIGFVAIVVAVVCLNVLYAWHGTTRDMTETEGIVVSVEQHVKHWTPKIRFEDAEGESHTFEGLSRKGYHPTMQEGDHVRIAYETANPDRAEELRARMVNSATLVILSIGILAFVGDKILNVF